MRALATAAAGGVSAGGAVSRRLRSLREQRCRSPCMASGVQSGTTWVRKDEDGLGHQADSTSVLRSDEGSPPQDGAAKCAPVGRARRIECCSGLLMAAGNPRHYWRAPNARFPGHGSPPATSWSSIRNIPTRRGTFTFLPPPETCPRSRFWRSRFRNLGRAFLQTVGMAYVSEQSGRDEEYLRPYPLVENLQTFGSERSSASAVSAME